MKKLYNITRREFLALAGATTVAHFIPGCKKSKKDPIWIPPDPKIYSPSGKIVSALDLSPIEGAEVHIGTEIANTDINGDWITPNLDPGDYDVIIADGKSETDFATYKAGILQINDANESWLSNLYWGLKPMSHIDFVYDTILKNTGLRTEDYNKKFTNIIYTKDWSGISDMPSAIVDLIKSYIKNEGSQYSNKTYTDADIQINNTDIPTFPPVNQETSFWWDSQGIGGDAGIWLNGDEIVSSAVRLSQNLGGSPNIESIILTEVIRIKNDGGDDSVNNTPHAYMGPAQTTTLNPPDILNKNLSYGVCKRPWGNEDKRTLDNYDINPVGYIIRPQ